MENSKEEKGENSKWKVWEKKEKKEKINGNGSRRIDGKKEFEQ